MNLSPTDTAWRTQTPPVDPSDQLRFQVRGRRGDLAREERGMRKSATSISVTPAQAGVHGNQAPYYASLDSGLRWNDEGAISLEGSVGQ